MSVCGDNSACQVFCAAEREKMAKSRFRIRSIENCFLNDSNWKSEIIVWKNVKLGPVEDSDWILMVFGVFSLKIAIMDMIFSL